MTKLPKPFDARAAVAKAPKAAYITDANPRESFIDEMRSYGFHVPPLPVLGKIERVQSPNDKKGKQSGWYFYNEVPDDYQPGKYIGIGVFGDWKGSIDRTVWTSKRRENMSTAEALHFEEQLKAEKNAREEELKRVRAEAAAKAATIWAEATPAPAEHPYLTAKGVQPHGVRVSRGKIIVPVQEDGALVSLQFIDVSGGKKFLGGGKTGGCSFKIEGNEHVVYVAEGFATGATLNEVTGATVYVAFNAGNLLEVTRSAKTAHPNSKIIIAGDDDHKTDGNPGREKANAAGKAMRCKVIFPEVDGDDTDFNDMAKAKGIEAVQDFLENNAVDQASAQLPAKTYDANFSPAEIPARPWQIIGLMLAGYITALLAPPGVGKSLFGLVVGFLMAIGRPSIGRTLRNTGNVLYLNNEDDEDEIDRRVSAICQYHAIPFEELTGKLFTLSGYGGPFLIARQDEKNTVVAHPDKQRIIDFCLKHDIKSMIVDPFISTHDVPENDNTCIEKVMTEYRAIAKATGASIMLIHHTSKGMGLNSEAHAGDERFGRGASSLIGAARIAVTLARMAKETATKEGIDWELGNRLIRLDDGKINFSLKSEGAEWHELKSVQIENGDSVGVPVPFDMGAITKCIEDVKIAKKVEHKEARGTEIASDVAACMTEDSMPQGEVIGAYMERVDKKRSAANDDMARLPVGNTHALRVNANAGVFRVWRERHGKVRLTYTIHRVGEE